MESAEFRKVWLPLGEAVYRVALYILEDTDDASDAVQDLFLKLWNSRDRLDSVQNPKAYAITLIRNLCIDRIRRATRARMVEADENLPAPEEDTMLAREKIQRVLNLIEGLPSRQRQLARMRLLDGLEYSEIARRTGVSENNARVLVSIARKTIKTKMEENERP